MKKSYIILLVVVLIGLVIGCTPKQDAPTIKKTNEVVKASFSEEYKGILKEHPYKEVDIFTVLDYFKLKETKIVYIGYPKCIKCQQLVGPLATAALNNNVKDISYLNAYEMRLNNTLEYKKLIEQLDLILGYDEEGNKTLIMPITLFIKDGVINNYYQGSLAQAPANDIKLDEAMTNELIMNLSNQIINLYNLGL